MLRALIALALLALPAVAHAQTQLSVDGCVGTWDIPVSAKKIEGRPNAHHAVVAGNVVFTCKELKLYADEASGDTDGDVVMLQGNVVLEQKALRLYADHAVINRKTRNGTFYEVHGTSQASMNTPNKDQFGGMEPDVAFWAREISKTGPDSFEIRDGAFTSCVQATPRWSMTGTKMGFVRDKRVTFWNAVLRVKDVPVFYIPFMYYPINKEDRSTGFLMPTFGSSGATGFFFSSAFFYAINRSMDATFYHDYLKRAGTGFGGEYRYAAAPGADGRIRLYTLGEKEKPAQGTTPAQPARRSYTVDANANQGLPRGFRLVGNTHYFSNATTQHLYNQNVLDYQNQDRSVTVGVSGGRARYRLAGTFDLRDTYFFNNGIATGSRHGYTPRVTLLMADAPIGHSRAYFGASTESAYLESVDNLAIPSTNRSLWRFDAKPRVQLPLSSLPFLNVTSSASYQITEWLESLDPITGLQEPTPLTRQLFSADVRVTGPVFARIWRPTGKRADRVKHVIEPNVGVQWLSPFDRLSEVVRIDGTDFIVGGTTTTTYGLTNRLLVRKRGTADAPGPVREVLSVDIIQSHYSNALASTADARYLPCATGDFSAIRLAATTRPTDKVSAQFNTDINPQFQTPCTLGATGAVNEPLFQISAGWSKRQYIPGLPGFDDPNFADHFLNGSATYRRANGHLGGTYTAQYDVRRGIFMQQRVVMFYNSQCCGFSIDYQKRDTSYLGPGNRASNHQFGIAFTLAGIGSFSNPLGSFGK